MSAPAPEFFQLLAPGWRRARVTPGAAIRVVAHALFWCGAPIAANDARWGRQA